MDSHLEAWEQVVDLLERARSVLWPGAGPKDPWAWDMYHYKLLPAIYEALRLRAEARKGCGKNGRVDPYGAGPDCKSGGLSPAGSEPATATTIKPSAGGA